MMGFARPEAQRTGVVVKALRFGNDHRHVWISPLDGGGDARDQAAAGSRCHHDIRGDAEPGHVFGDLAPRRALPRDHQRVVVGRNDGGAAFAGDLPRNGFAVVAVAIV